MPKHSMPTKGRRSMRRAAREAAKKIKKIARDDSLLEAKVAKVARRKRRKEAPTTPKCPFYDHKDIYPSFSISLPSLSSIPEEACLSELTMLTVDQDILRNIEEEEREIRRQKRLINSSGTMYLSEKNKQRIELFSPRESPFYVEALELTPFAGIPTTPMQVYQFGSQPERSAPKAASSFAQRLRQRSRGKEEKIKPRNLLA